MDRTARLLLLGLAACGSAAFGPGLFDLSVGRAWAEDAPSIAWPDASRRVEIRRPFGGSEIVVGASSRTAGAIDSLVWNGKEFINSFDHGRELQSAAFFDGYGECLNPTEAGSESDGLGERSSSLLLRLRTGPGRLETRTDMAFWYDVPTTQRKCTAKPPPYGAARAGFILDKRVTIGVPGVPNAITYRATFTVPRAFKGATFEVLTGYMPPDFSSFWTYDPANDRLAPLSDGPGEQELPVILATPDGAYAMGAYSPTLPQKAFPGFGYGRFRFAQLRGAGNATVKWNCVVRRNNGAAGPHGFTCHTLVGTLEDVRQGIAALHARARR